MEVTRSPFDIWKCRLNEKADPISILLCGAKVWENSYQTDHRKHVPRAEWTTTDIFAGPEVDIVGDLQSLWQTCSKKFDGIFCPAVLEHIERPWTAVYSMSQMLKPFGVLHIQTHQTFPLHGYPHDYFRFSQQALQVLCHDAGLEVVASGYDGPCTITPVSCPIWNPVAEAFLNVTICAMKPGNS